MLKYRRYHCYKSTGEKVICCSPVDVIPVNLDDHTPWLAGTGPITGDALERLREGVGKTRGRPKSAEHRAKISAGNKGKAKSPEHCQAMSLAHRKRRAELREQRHANT